MNRIFLWLVLTLFSPVAFAAGGGHGEEPARAPGAPTVELPPFMAPVTVQGELRFYMYVVLKLDLTSDFKKSVVLEKVPYIQDAVLRDVHKSPIGSPADPEKIDEAVLAARFKPVVEAVLGPGVVDKVGFRNLTRAAH